MEGIQPVENIIVDRNIVYPEADYLSGIQIKEGDLKKKEKKKKERSVSNLTFLLGKKRRTTKPPSEIAKFTNELISKGLKTPEEIRSYLVTQGRKISENELSFFDMLVNSYVVNGNMRISDILANKPIYGFYYFGSFLTRVISNDALYTRALLEANFNFNVTLEIEQKLFRYTTLDKAIYASVPFKCVGKVEKGYYQDYTGSFVAVGVQTLDDEKKQQLFSEQSLKNVNLNYFNEKYNVYSLDSAVVISPENMDINEIKNNYNKMKTFNSSGKIALEAKSFDVKGKVRYIESKITPELFCPAFLEIPERVSFTILGRGKYDYNKLFSIMEDEYKKKDKIKYRFPPNFIYWTNIPQCFDFISVFSVTSNIGLGEKQVLNTLYSEYIELKDTFMAWKSIQLKLERILLDFYHAFSNKVKFDVLQGLHKKVADYIHDKEILLNDENHEKFMNFINEYSSMCGLIKNQLSKQVFDVVDNLKFVLLELDSGNSKDLLKNLRDLGYAIYRLGYYIKRKDEKNEEYDKQFYPSFPFILSPGAFLGNVLLENNIAEDPLKKIVDIISRRREREFLLKQDKGNELYNVLTNRDKYAADIIRNSVENYLKNNNQKLNRKAIDHIVNNTINSIDENTRAKVYGMVTDAYIAKKDPSQEFIEEEVISPYVLPFLRKMDAKKKENEIKKISLENQILDLNNEKDMIELDEKSMGGMSTISKTYTRTKKKKTKIYDALAKQINYAKKGDMIGKYYMDIVYYSNLYTLKKDDLAPFASNSDLRQLMTQFKVSPEAIDMIVEDFNLPDVDEVLENGYDERIKPKYDKFIYTEENVRKVKEKDPTILSIKKRFGK